jgi:hypothetical protein
MSTKQFTIEQVLSTVAACIGKRLSLETIKAIAMESGADILREFGEAVRLQFVTQFRHQIKAGRESFAYMQKDKVPGVSTFYTYMNAVLKLQCKGEKGDADAIIELAALTTGKLVAKKGPAAGAKTRKSATPAQPEARPLTADDCIAFLQSAQKLGGLTAAHYSALQALLPPASVKHMGNVDEVLPALKIAA